MALPMRPSMSTIRISRCYVWQGGCGRGALSRCVSCGQVTLTRQLLWFGACPLAAACKVVADGPVPQRWLSTEALERRKFSVRG